MGRYYSREPYQKDEEPIIMESPHMYKAFTFHFEPKTRLNQQEWDIVILPPLYEACDKHGIKEIPNWKPTIIKLGTIRPDYTIMVAMAQGVIDHVLQSDDVSGFISQICDSWVDRWGGVVDE